MTVDHFAQFSARRHAEIESKKHERATGFFLPDHRWEEPVYLIEGIAVTKEEFILKSGMEHHLPDVSSVKCSKCGCQDSPRRWHQRCGMPLVNGIGRCDGVFF